MELSNSQITKLGDRLRNGVLVEEDLKMLDAFRQTFSKVDEQVYKNIHDSLRSCKNLTITKRKRKTQQSIVDKLKRQPKLRLPQMQDVAGCRIVVQGGIQAQQNINTILLDGFVQNKWQVESKDRNAIGYYATHIIVKAENKFYEIQVRTFAQDIWANIVESKSDENNTLKYGGSEEEQPLMYLLKTLAEHFNKIDQEAHQVDFNSYQLQIQEAIKDVLSH
jgi:ppGpp synthetase/RelA/SpoT-type nucleotidyltranferase